MNIVLISSTIHTSQNKYTYTNTRSVFTHEQRLNQTIDTIDSIRKYIPDSYIILAENSQLDINEQNMLKTDQTIIFNDTESIKWRDCNFKGSGEAFVLEKCLKLIKNKKFNRIFKISGRYSINSSFQYENHCVDKFVFLKSGNLEKSICTVLYSVPMSFLKNYKKQLKHCLDLYNKSSFSIEDVLAKDIPLDDILFLSKIGVEGKISCNGNLWSK